MKKIALILMMLLALPKVMPAKEFYAIVSNDGQTMTFYYDDFRLYKAGTSYYDREGWKAAASTVTSVYFDESLSSDSAPSYRPKSTQAWFSGFKKLRYVNHLENLNTMNVTSMQSMFSECESLQQLDVSKLHTGNVVNMKAMFYHCSNLTSINVTHFDMKKVEDITSMFDGCKKINTLDLTFWDLGNIKHVKWLFRNCSNLTTIYVEHGAEWRNYHKIVTWQDMFLGCVSIVGGNGTTYNSSQVSLDQALHDAKGHSGYFSAHEYLTIGGERITKEGKQQLSCIKGGEVYYSEMDGLTLYCAVIVTPADEGGIYFTEGGSISLLGDNYIQCGIGDGINVTGGDLAIDGGGKLELVSVGGYGISFSDMLEVSATKGPTELYIAGYYGALDGQKHYSTYYNEDRCGYLSNYRAKMWLASGGHETPVVHDLSSMEGAEEDWFYNYDYVFDKDQLTVVDLYYEIPVTNPFMLSPEKPEGFNIYLGGQQINLANFDDYLPQSLSSGYVVFDPIENTLLLNDAKFDGPCNPYDDTFALKANALDFTLSLYDDNTLVGNDNGIGYYFGICFDDYYYRHNQDSRHWTICEGSSLPLQVDYLRPAPATLRYSGNVEFVSSKEAYVTIADVNLKNEADDWATFCASSNLSGDASNSPVHLTVAYSSIDLGEGSKGWDFSGFASVTLIGCHFENGFYYDSNERVVKDSNGDKKAGPVRIVCDDDATGIAPKRSDDTAASRIQQPSPTYNLQGQRVDSSYRGIIVRNGKKILVK